MHWLHLLARLGLGACLADDMGLGKTIQVLSLLLVLKDAGGRQAQAVACSWRRPRCSPTGRRRSRASRRACKRARRASLGACRRSSSRPERPSTSPTSISSSPATASWPRAPWLDADAHGAWRCSTRHRRSRIPAPSRPARSSSSRPTARIALTGTPIENRLGDLWSIFDFINPGLLGSAKQFSAFVKRLAERPQNPYGPLRELVRPYILRRMKTDKSIIADLPDKTEVKAFCALSRKQAALYQQAVERSRRRARGCRGHRSAGAWSWPS